MKPINGSGKRGPSLARGLHGERFHAVDIHVPANACEAVKALAERRFLSRERPPLLPLSDCDRAGECQCRYRHHEDRRAEQRREKWGGSDARPSGTRMRTSRGRRDED